MGSALTSVVSFHSSFIAAAVGIGLCGTLAALEPLGEPSASLQKLVEFAGAADKAKAAYKRGDSETFARHVQSAGAVLRAVIDEGTPDFTDGLMSACENLDALTQAATRGNLPRDKADLIAKLTECRNTLAAYYSGGGSRDALAAFGTPPGKGGGRTVTPCSCKKFCKQRPIATPCRGGRVDPHRCETALPASDTSSHPYWPFADPPGPPSR